MLIEDDLAREPLQVRVVLVGGKEVSLDVHLGSKCEEIKHKISELFSNYFGQYLPPEKQTLRIGSRVLHDRSPLSVYNLFDGAILELTLQNW